MSASRRCYPCLSARHGMPTLDNEKLNEQGQTLIRSAGLIGLVFMIGVVGYMVITAGEASLVDAIYMTLITLTTVGYAEVIDLSGSPAGRIFTSLLLVVGVGSFVYFFSNFTAFLVEGNLDRYLWRRRMRKVLDDIDNHYIVCGGGRIGVNMIKELIATERRFVLIERDESVARRCARRGGSRGSPRTSRSARSIRTGIAWAPTSKRR